MSVCARELCFVCVCVVGASYGWKSDPIKKIPTHTYLDSFLFSVGSIGRLYRMSFVKVTHYPIPPHHHL